MKPPFYPLTVQATQQETKEATTVMFAVPTEWQPIFQWRAGQHLTLRCFLNGEELRRAYSISASPFSGDPLRITVKRVKGGRVSTYINDQLKPGATLEVMPPFGGFQLDPEANKRRTHYFFGAGSGVTPLFAMLHSVLLAEPYSDVRFAYGNIDAKHIIFQQALAQLCAEYGQRLSIAHILSAPALWSNHSYWRKGRLDQAASAAFINAHPPYAQDTQYYICGPGGMNEAVQTALLNLDVPAARIHSESYGGAVETDDSISGIAASARVTLRGVEHTVAVAAGQTLLAANRAAGLEPPFTCEAGVCGACRAQLLDGSVQMRARMALTEEAIAAGAILTCQALATTPTLTLQYPES